MGDNILQTVGHPKWLIVMANLMVVCTQGHALTVDSGQFKQLPLYDPQQQADNELESLSEGSRKSRAVVR